MRRLIPARGWGLARVRYIYIVYKRTRGDRARGEITIYEEQKPNKKGLALSGAFSFLSASVLPRERYMITSFLPDSACMLKHMR